MGKFKSLLDPNQILNPYKLLPEKNRIYQPAHGQHQQSSAVTRYKAISAFSIASCLFLQLFFSVKQVMGQLELKVAGAAFPSLQQPAAVPHASALAANAAV